MRHAPRLAGTPETLCCHQTARVHKVQLRRCSIDLTFGLAVYCARTAPIARLTLEQP